MDSHTEQSPPVESAQQIQPVNQPPSPRPSNIFIALIIFIVVTIVGIGGYLFATKNQSTQNQAKNLAQPTIPQPSPTIDPKADWQTYRNEEFGFEVKYPREWSRKVIDDAGNFFIVNVVSPSGSTLAICPKAGGCPDHGLEAYYKAEDGVVKLREKSAQQEIWNWQEDGKHYLTSLSAQDFWQYEGYDDGELRFYTGQEGKDQDLAVFDQILSTFRFVDATNDSLKILSPNGGEILKTGETYEIRWEAYGIEEVYISLVSGGKEFGILAAVPAVQGRYEWTVPDMSGWIESGLQPDNFKIFIHNNSATNDIRDYSDGTFTIIE